MLTAGGAVVAACQQTFQDIATVTPVPPSSTPDPGVKLSLTGGNQDAWTWIKQVRVGVTEGDCESVILQANGQSFGTSPKNGAFTTEIPLSEGENQVTAACQLPGGGKLQAEPVIITGRLRQAPRAEIQIALEGDRIVLDGCPSTPAQDGAGLVDHVWSARGSNPAPLQLENGDLAGEVSSTAISVIPPNVDGEYYVSLKVTDEAGREDTSTTYFVVEAGQPRIPDYDHEHSAWVERSVIYGIVPFLFGSPAFQAIMDRLDNLSDLGINAIWLGPINTHPSDDYGYAVEDYFDVDRSYGTKEDFRALVEAAHQRGIRVLIDFVPSHSSDTHPYFLDAQERGPDSPYWDFYDRDEQGNYTYFFNYDHLPNLNYDNPEVRQMIVEAFAYWVREFDVDGFRVDFAWAIRERRPDFWPGWRRELKRIKPDLLLLAEATAREPYFFDNGFDVAYDWTYRPGGWAWEVVWSAYKYRLLAYNLTDALTNRPEGFHPDAVILRFINNNDTGQRFITKHGEGVTRVATALVLTLTGVPLIYTGDEYALEFEPYQRLEPLIFEEQVRGLRAYHKRLIELKKEVPSLYSRQMSLLVPDAVPQTVFSYIRYGEPSEMPVLVLLNFSEEPTEFKFDLSEEFSALSQETLYDLLAEEEVPAMEGGRMSISVPGQTARILAGQPAG